MTNYDNIFDGIDSVSFEEEYENQGYPRVYWFNGVKQAQTAGKFYTSAKDYNVELGAPWQSVELFSDGEGYQTEKLSIVPIRKRYQAYFERKEGNRTIKEWLPAGKYEEGARIYTEILCYMQGYDGLVILTVKGLTGKALTGKVGGVFSTFKDTVISVAKETLKKGKKIPPFAFWIPIATERDAKGKVFYRDTGYGSTTTPPALDIKGQVSRDDCVKLYVGRELLARLADWYKEHDEWRTTYRTNDTPLMGSTPTAPAAAEPQMAKNEPVPFDSDDMWN